MKYLLPAAALLLVSASPIFSQQAWKQGRTSDGQSDIQGVWTSYTITPLERPARWAGKTTLTPEEVEAYEEERAKAAAQYPRPSNDVGGDTWLDPGSKMLYGGQTSMVIDPPDGKVPVKPEAEVHRQFMLQHSADSWEYMSVWDRCLTRGVPGGMFPANNDNGYQIYQTPGYVVVFYENIHEAHIIPLDLAPDGKSSCTDCPMTRSSAERRFPWPVERQYARRRDDELRRNHADRHQRRAGPIKSHAG